MTERTPGPWEIGPQIARYAATGKGARKLVAVGLPISFRAMSIGGGPHRTQVALVPLDESNEANARAITATPDLLEVCQEAVGKLEEAQEMMEREGFVIDDLDDRWQKLAFTLYNMLVETAAAAEAAVAKIEGEGDEDDAYGVSG